MRILFYVFLFIAASIYTYIAFTDLSFLSNRGRMGAGFFPRIVGVAILASLMFSLLLDYKNKIIFSEDNAGFKYEAKDAIVLILFSSLFVVLFVFLGYFVAIPAYIGAVLFYFNRGKFFVNISVMLLLPASVYLLFGQLLNAALPMGIFAN